MRQSWLPILFHFRRRTSALSTTTRDRTRAPTAATFAPTRDEILYLGLIRFQSQSNYSQLSVTISICISSNKSSSSVQMVNAWVFQVQNQSRGITSLKAMLDKHVKSVHLKERPYACHLCDKRFGQKVHLEVHMSGVHMKERPYGELRAVRLFPSKQSSKALLNLRFKSY